mmetsp:Transcript_7697/g.25121  ORF Transcript_7697/g.25121 Transcript_7697/m.25121 type:complete len:366 (-) Transcript_7697:916-2013(-)
MRHRHYRLHLRLQQVRKRAARVGEVARAAVDLADSRDFKAKGRLRGPQRLQHRSGSRFQVRVAGGQHGAQRRARRLRQALAPAEARGREFGRRCRPELLDGEGGFERQGARRRRALLGVRLRRRRELGRHLRLVPRRGLERLDDGVGRLAGRHYVDGAQRQRRQVCGALRLKRGGDAVAQAADLRRQRQRRVDERTDVERAQDLRRHRASDCDVDVAPRAAIHRRRRPRRRDDDVVRPGHVARIDGVCDGGERRRRGADDDDYVAAAVLCVDHASNRLQRHQRRYDAGFVAARRVGPEHAAAAHGREARRRRVGLDTSRRVEQNSRHPPHFGRARDDGAQGVAPRRLGRAEASLLHQALDDVQSL